MAKPESTEQSLASFKAPVRLTPIAPSHAVMAIGIKVSRAVKDDQRLKAVLASDNYHAHITLIPPYVLFSKISTKKGSLFFNWQIRLIKLLLIV